MWGGGLVGMVLEWSGGIQEVWVGGVMVDLWLWGLGGWWSWWSSGGGYGWRSQVKEMQSGNLPRFCLTS